ncbi:transposase [Streptomyces sp. SS7]|uniref:transposase n=1 Tax=Streptomyces sp. SS7 TaxID=3108485 RepID=UPI0030EDAB23
MATIIETRGRVTGLSPAVIAELVAEVGPLWHEQHRVVTPPHRKFKKNAPTWYEEHEQQRKAHSSRRIRVEHGIAHLKNWRALARHLGRREHMSDIVHTSTCHAQPCTRSLI